MKKIILAPALLLGILFFSGCGNQQNIINKEAVENETVLPNNVEEEFSEKVLSEEMIDFEHPGSDEVGKKIEEMDTLINSTSSDGYEDDFSAEILAEQE